MSWWPGISFPVRGELARLLWDMAKVAGRWAAIGAAVVAVGAAGYFAFRGMGW